MAKLAIIGYGKMGKMLEKLIHEHPGHTLVWVKDYSPSCADLKMVDAAIEFSVPEAAEKNILKCFESNTPIVSGTTGWTEKLHVLIQKANEEKHSFLYASNFSIGMNLFFFLNRKLAQLMDAQPDYDVHLKEIHHIQKQDSPSGTAITLANDIIKNLKRKQNWINKNSSVKDELVILSKRVGDVNGIHEVEYSSADELITLKHTALSRQAFAKGAIMAAAWLIDKKGFYTMKDVLNLH